MRVLGIDLSTDPVKTWECLLESGPSGVSLCYLAGGRDDDDLLAAMSMADVTGIDCPLGWPDPFLAAIQAHSETRRWPGRNAPDTAAYRRSLLLRATDLAIKAATGTNPLSVSGDRLAATAMRCALLQDVFVRDGFAIDRTGLSGPLVEVYPRAALWRWGLAPTGYKGSAGHTRRGELVENLLSRLPGLRLTPADKTTMADNDDALDALVCALVALAARRDPPLTVPPPPGLISRARTEGWIHLPVDGSLEALCT